MGQPGRKCLKSLPVKKIQNIRLIMPLANRLVPSPPAKLCGGKGSGKERGLLGSFPPRFAYFPYIGLEQELAEAERYLSIMGSATGSSPPAPCGISGGYGGDGVGELMIAAGFKDHAGLHRLRRGSANVRPRDRRAGVARKRISWSGTLSPVRWSYEFVLGGRGTVKGFVDGCWAGDVELYFGQRVQADEAFEQGGFRPSVCMQTVRPPLASCCTSSTK